MPSDDPTHTAPPVTAPPVADTPSALPPVVTPGIPAAQAAPEPARQGISSPNALLLYLAISIMVLLGGCGLFSRGADLLDAAFPDENAAQERLAQPNAIP